MKSRLVVANPLETEQLEYPVQRQLRLSQQQEELWICAICIYRIIQSEDCLGMVWFSKSYERFSKIEPNFYISKARFLFCVRQVFANESFTTQHDLLLREIDIFYQKLVYEKDKISWRNLYLLIFVLDNPKWSFRDITTRILSLLFGDGSSAFSMVECTGRLKISWFCDSVEPFIKLEGKKTFFDNVYGALYETSSTGTKILKGGLETMAHWKHFTMILDHKLLADLCDKHQQWGKRGAAAYLSEAEMRYYPVPFRKYLQSQRRDIRQKYFFLLTIFRRKKEIMKRWKLFTCKRKKSRLLLERVVICKSLQIRREAFCRLVKYSIWSIASQCIQSKFRGVIGKMELSFRLILFTTAVLIQTTFRLHSQRKKILSFFCYRIKSATKIQCSIRRLLSRRITINRLLTFINKERRQLSQQKKMWVEKNEFIAAMFVQKAIRRLRGWKKGKKMKETLNRELIAAREIEKLICAYRLERAIQQKELEQYYEHRRLGWKRLDEEKTRCDNVKVDMERIRVKFDNAEAARKKKNDILRFKEEHMENINEQIQQMKLAVISKTREYRENCTQCIHRPECREEVKKGRQLKEIIKKRSQTLLKHVDAQKLYMEKPEIYLLAEKEILDKKEEEERQRLSSALELEESRLYQQYIHLQNELIDSYERQSSLEKNRVNKAICKAIQLMRARKRFRDECRDVYEKRFDEKLHSYFYINRRTGDSFWGKPKVFGNGSFDIEPKAGWIVMRDAQGFPYYFNPKTMKMSWKPPLDLVICQNTISYTWWKLYPYPTGQCFYFATKQCKDGQWFCDSCWSNL